MSSWTGSEDYFYTSDESLEAQQALGTTLYPAQTIPCVESAGDTDSDDEVEDIIFSGLQRNHAEELLPQDGPIPHSLRQTLAKPLYSWQPSSPGADTQVSTSWSSLSQGHQSESTPAKPDNQQQNDPHQCQVVQMAPTSSTNSFQEDGHQSSTAGWFSGAAGQLAASRQSTAAEPADSPSRQHEHSSTETEEETEQAFQCSVHSASDPVPTSTTVQLTAAVHDMDIDHLLQKLICGELEYNPHDPNSGLPPASSLFTDSEASSEAEEDKAALHSQAPARSAVQSCGAGRCADVSADKEPLQLHNGAEPKQSPLVVAPCSDSQGSHQQPLKVHQQQGDSQTKSAKGAYIRHRQTSRLANRFQRHQDYHAEDGVAEEFDDWCASRARLKQKSRC